MVLTLLTSFIWTSWSLYGSLLCPGLFLPIPQMWKHLVLGCRIVKSHRCYVISHDKGTIHEHVFNVVCIIQIVTTNNGCPTTLRLPLQPRHNVIVTSELIRNKLCTLGKCSFHDAQRRFYTVFQVLTTQKNRSHLKGPVFPLGFPHKSKTMRGRGILPNVWPKN